jgi:tetratricopeptide (TPR) repeat protein
MIAAAGLEAGPMPHTITSKTIRSAEFGIAAILLGLLIASQTAFGSALCGDDEPPKASKTGKGKCPAGYHYSSSKHTCAKVSCRTGKAWSHGEEACLGVDAASLTDEDYFNEARLRVEHERFAEALDLLFRIKNQDQAKVLNYIGYSTRMLGDVEKGIAYYNRALELDSNYLRAREYLGEGYLQRGDVASAKEQLEEIANRCGGPCEEYEMLVGAIAAYITGEPSLNTYAAAKRPSS